MTYIDQKLFAYIEHKNNMTSDISKRYQNSIILIGDEQQLYNPLTNTYVGIGYSSYINTRDYILNKINQSSEEIYIKDFKNNSSDTYYIPMINNYVSDWYYHAYSTSRVGINPSEGAFVGNLIGTADNATKATTSTLSNTTHKVHINKIADNYVQGTYLMLSKSNTNNTYTYTYFNSDLYYDSKENHLYTKVSYASYAYNSTDSIYSLMSMTSKIYETSTDYSYYITFVNENNSYQSSYVNGDLLYNPYSKTLSTQIVTANELIGQLDPSLQWGTI